MTENSLVFDWKKIEDLAQSEFTDSLRAEMERNFRWHRARSDDYSADASSADFRRALVTLQALQKSSFSCFQLEPIADELTTVQWYFEVMAQAPDVQAVSVKYLLYSRIWHCIGKAGVKLSRGRGIPNHRLSHAQKVFREICRQAGIDFTSDQALADVLKRALKAVKPTGAK